VLGTLRDRRRVEDQQHGLQEDRVQGYSTEGTDERPQSMQRRKRRATKSLRRVQQFLSWWPAYSVLAPPGVRRMRQPQLSMSQGWQGRADTVGGKSVFLTEELKASRYLRGYEVFRSSW
jgi:hypothetical protein